MQSASALCISVAALGAAHPASPMVPARMKARSVAKEAQPIISRFCTPTSSSETSCYAAGLETAMLRS